ncbi:uncharacterized protein LOC106154507 [Lingula anatina]|uniref:Uncharacterized protein LOC106154507 n=1 Tax=Lingula anatina TaxID=7574 RepID=A0A1S3HE83_LINAN|nr:uncharacterized protein LOC106154507 [Lingula anatina]|eukprot:XP_013384363.1 uncharacterized protein LOC106154507 [Lingula anatina]
MPGGFYWSRNMMGQKLTDEQMREIPHANVELFGHVTIKTVQAGAFLGTLLTGPLTQAIRGPRTLNAIMETAARHGRNGAIIGLVLGPAMTFMKCNSMNWDEEGIYDRCYRLRYNRNQVRVDRASALGATAGYLVALQIGVSGATGFVFGMTGGVVLSAVYNSMFCEKHV